jgi:hypothetical protein
LSRPNLYLLAALAGLALAAAPAGAGPASPPDPVPVRAAPLAAPDERILPGNVHPLLAAAGSLGPAPADAPMERMILALRPPEGALERAERRLAELQDPGSPRFHQWLTPEAFGAEFGPGPEAVARVTDWLRDEGFRIEDVAAGRLSVTFSGTVAQVERTFRTPIRRFRVGGRVRQGNAADPAVPRRLADLVEGVVSLHNLPRKALNTGFAPAGPELRTTDHVLTPGDFASIYNVRPLYQQGVDGTGVTIAVVGRTHPPAEDVAAFRAAFGLPARDPEILIHGPDPGDLGSAENGEAHLDMEWSGAVAPGATVRFVAAASTDSTDGVDLAARFIIDHNLAPIMTTSFGQCEDFLGAAERAFVRNLWVQAALQGITTLVSSGDSGCADCGLGSDKAGTGRAVNGLASTPFNVAVGGTQFDEGAGTYWRSGPDPDGSSAIAYIPERAWNESGAAAGGSGLWAGGGGASCYWPRPCWQLAPGVPRDARHRYLPDVALSAAGAHDPYVIRSGGRFWRVGGTSCSAPAFAGLMALVVQRTGERQGNPNPVFYKLFNAQYRGRGPAVFHDVAAGDNSVPGTRGWPAAAGYDLATGLGSVDASALAQAWTGGYGINVSAVIRVPAGDLTVPGGAAVTFLGEGRSSVPGPPVACAWQFGDGARASGSRARHTFRNTGPAPVDRVVTFTATDVSGTYESDARTIRVLPEPAQGERLVNGGFEQGELGWRVSNVTLGANGGEAGAHLGAGSAWFSGWLIGNTEAIRQTVALPPGPGPARLRFWLKVIPHGPADQALDLFQVKVRGGDGRLAILATRSNLDQAPDFREHVIDLSAYRGQRIQLAFTAAISVEGPSTSFVLDDASLIAP